MSLPRLDLSVPTFDVQSVWFRHLVSGRKKVEGRKATSKWMELVESVEINPLVILTNDQGDQALFNITEVREYTAIRPYRPAYEPMIEYIKNASALSVYLMSEGLRYTLPGVDQLPEAIDVYRQWNTDDELITNDFLAFEMTYVCDLF